PGRTSWVAGRTGKPCRRCATPIRKADQPSYDGNRVTYWCPTCQPGPGGATRV
ncbi:MAG TPA: zinc finger domain-containing protein, partial [Actinomycetota bacterium]|nr:zinc finger domain-containing protein [Actinomycetota bacterium]